LLCLTSELFTFEMFAFLNVLSIVLRHVVCIETVISRTKRCFKIICYRWDTWYVLCMHGKLGDITGNIEKLFWTPHTSSWLHFKLHVSNTHFSYDNQWNEYRIARFHYKDHIKSFRKTVKISKLTKRNIWGKCRYSISL